VAQIENFRGPVTMYGRSPVWTPAGYALQGTVHVEASGTPDPYPRTLIIWEVGPTTYPSVTAKVTDLRTGELAWWSGNSSQPEKAVLAFGPAGALPTADFREYLSVLILTHSGCYKLDVTWAGREWSSIFAAGRRTQP
jgi:hypothetical protein